MSSPGKMPQISTMDLSIQTLENWKRDRKVFSSPVARSSKNGNMDIKQEPETEDEESSVSTDHADIFNNSNFLRSRSTGRRKMSVRNMGSHYPISESHLETRATSESNDSVTSAQQSQQSQIKTSKSMPYKKILEMSSLGLRMCETEAMTQSLHDRIQLSLHTSRSTGTSEPESSQADALKALTQTKQLHEEILTKIVSLAGDSQMKTMRARIEALEKRHLEDRKEIACLKRQMGGLLERFRESHKKRLTSNGYDKQLISDSEESEDDNNWETSSDEDQPARPARMLRRSKDFEHSSNVSHSSTERPKLSVETERFIDECNLKMKWHGLLHRNVLHWSESQVPPLQWPLRLIGRFLNKKLKEEECQELTAHFRNFLEDMVNNKHQRQSKRPRMESTVVSYAESSVDSESSASSSSSSLCIEELVSSSSGTASPVPLEGRQEDEPEELSEDYSSMSNETENFIDNCVTTMNNLGLSYKVLLAWWADNSTTKLDLRTVSHFMHKRMKEKECQSLIPLMKLFLEDHQKNSQTGSNSAGSSSMPSPQKKCGRTKRTVYSATDKQLLEEAFKKTPYPSSSQKALIGKMLHVSPAQVKNWFKRRRSTEAGKLK